MNFILTAVLIYFAFQPATDWVASSAAAHHLTGQAGSIAKPADIAALVKVWPVIFFFACHGSAIAILTPLRSLAAGHRKSRAIRPSTLPIRPTKRTGG